MSAKSTKVKTGPKHTIRKVNNGYYYGYYGGFPYSVGMDFDGVWYYGPGKYVNKHNAYGTCETPQEGIEKTVKHADETWAGIVLRAQAHFGIVPLGIGGDSSEA